MNNYLRISEFIANKNNEKILFTAGPASLLEENVLGLQPCFGRGDDNYNKTEESVLQKLKEMSGHKNIARMQGSGSLGLEVMASNFLYGKVLVIQSGYYSQRLLELSKFAQLQFREIKEVSEADWTDLESIQGSYDWIFACYTETSIGLKLDIKQLRQAADKAGAKLMIDATASIGLETNHELADVLSYSSCKGLFGLTGAAFVSFNGNPKIEVKSFYLSLENHLNKKMTGPYHSIASLELVLENHDDFLFSVIKNKETCLEKFEEHLKWRPENQPLLCTFINQKIIAYDERAILYSPRSNLKGSVVCHLGEVHLGKGSTAEAIKSLGVEK